MPEVTDSWEEWKATWEPIRRPRAVVDPDDEMNAYLFDPHDAEDVAMMRELGGESWERLWTLRDAGGMALSVSAGFHLVDRMGYLLTRRAHAGYEATPMLLLGDPDICVVPEEMTDDELREALDGYEEDVAREGDDGEARKNLDLLQAEAERRRLLR